MVWRRVFSAFSLCKPSNCQRKGDQKCKHQNGQKRGGYKRLRKNLGPSIIIIIIIIMRKNLGLSAANVLAVGAEGSDQVGGGEKAVLEDRIVVFPTTIIV